MASIAKDFRPEGMAANFLPKDLVVTMRNWNTMLKLLA